MNRTKLGIGLLLVLGLLFVCRRSPVEKDSPTEVQLNGGFAPRQDRLFVLNRSDDDWTNVEVMISTERDCGGTLYHATVARLPAQSWAAVPLTDFITLESERFQPSKFAYRTATVKADTPSGRGFYGKTW